MAPISIRLIEVYSNPQTFHRMVQSPRTRDPLREQQKPEGWTVWLTRVLGLLSLLFELWRAPIVVVPTAIAMLLAVWRLGREMPRAARELQWPVTQLAVMLLSGLWIGVFVVFWMADSNVDSSITSTIPIRFDGEAVSAEALLGHGLLSTFASAASWIGFKPRRSRHRRRRRST